MNTRLIRISISLAFTIYMTLVCFNNITDYSSNFTFVSKVAGMEDVFSQETTGWRSIQDNTLHHIMYISIILVELCIAILLMSGSIKMISNYKSSAEVFQSSKKLTITALATAVLLFLIFFITIAGEWFLMWQSEQWNAQQTAFSLTTIFLLALIFMNQDEK
jgi:predicted small integral membrane protein